MREGQPCARSPSGRSLPVQVQPQSQSRRYARLVALANLQELAARRVDRLHAMHRIRARDVSNSRRHRQNSAYQHACEEQLAIRTVPDQMRKYVQTGDAASLDDWATIERRMKALIFASQWQCNIPQLSIENRLHIGITSLRRRQVRIYPKLDELLGFVPTVCFTSIDSQIISPSAKTGDNDQRAKTYSGESPMMSHN